MKREIETELRKVVKGIDEKRWWVDKGMRDDIIMKVRKLLDKYGEHDCSGNLH